MDQLKSIDWRGLAKAASNKVKMYALNLSPLEVMVEDATSLETWGPHGSVMNDIAEACFDPEGYRQVLGVLARRLQAKDQQWRMCYKALLLLEHLIKHGPAKVAQDTASSMTVLERLQRFEFKDPNGKDHGANVRHRAKEVADLVSSPARVAEEREKARANKAKYKGVSSSDMRSGFGSDSFGRSGSGGFNPSSLVRPGGAAPASSGISGAGGSFGESAAAAAAAPRTYAAGGDAAGGHHFISKRPDAATAATATTTGSSSSSGAAKSPRDDGDPVAATRARIERIRLAEGGERGDERGGEGGEGAPGKKKLTDVKVNPRIAASLGLKVAQSPQQPKPTGTAAASPSAPEIDLLGGLDDPEPGHAAGSEGGAAGGWDAFGSSSGSGQGTSAAAPAPAPALLDAFGASPPGSTGAAKAAAGGRAPPRAALPEDAFASLAGLAKPSPPMGSPAGLRAQPPLPRSPPAPFLAAAPPPRRATRVRRLFRCPGASSAGQRPFRRPPRLRGLATLSFVELSVLCNCCTWGNQWWGATLV